VFEQPMCAAVPLIPHPGSWIMRGSLTFSARPHNSRKKDLGEKRHTTAGGVHLGARLHNTQLDLNGEVPLELSEVALARRAILTVRAEPNLGPL